MPTYEAIRDYTEALEVDFEPDVVPLSHLLELFWGSHDPFRPGFNKQYAHAIWYRPHQETAMRESVEKLEALKGKKIATTVAPFVPGNFHVAENYHQKYTLRHHKDVVEALGLRNDDARLRDSTAAARLNGWLAGHVPSVDECRKEAQQWNLSPEAAKVVFAEIEKPRNRQHRRCI